MGLRDRTRRLERLAEADRDAPCSECGGRIPYIVREGGETSYPFGKPCGSCEGVPTIEVVMEGDDGD